MVEKAKKVPVKQQASKAVRTGEVEVHPWDALRRDVNELMESFNRGWANLTAWEPLRGGSLPFWSAKSTHVPRTDVTDSGKSYDISIELPGMDEKDIEVSVTGERLSVSGEKKSETEKKAEGYYLAERSYGSFMRSFPLPDDADAAKISAAFAKGVLTITIPKTASSKAKSKKISVKSS
jgi:HSP20 family protein